MKKGVSGPDIFHQKYTGQVDDASQNSDNNDSELMYYNARYYDAKLGRFISADTLVPGAGLSQSYNVLCQQSCRVLCCTLLI